MTEMAFAVASMGVTACTIGTSERTVGLTNWPWAVADAANDE